jgi:hypothetical protein
MELIMVKFIGIACLHLYLIFIMVLVFNLHKKSKIIKAVFATLILVFVALLLQYNDSVLDSVLSLVVRYLYFPSFATFMVIIFGSLGILFYSIFNEKLTINTRIINFVFASWIVIVYLIFVLLRLDVTSYLSLYTGTSLICLRFVSRGFLLWIVVLTSIRFFHYFTSLRWKK